MHATVGVLRYPGAQEAAVLGLRDLFATAQRLHGLRGGRPAEVEVSLLRCDRAPPRVGKPLDILILPPSLGATPPTDGPRTLVRWLVAQHRRGTTLCSICAGAFLLAETGLLDGRPATTHWGLGEVFSSRFPAVRLDVDRLVVDDGDIVTAGGVMAWVDLGLRFIDRLYGPTTMLMTARHFLVDPGGREQRFYSAFAPPLTHGDDAILKAQRWLQRKSGEKVDIARMAGAAGLGTRTFFRRFHLATGLRPTEYLQHVRVARARDWLERSGKSIDEIALGVGYEDTGAFRKTFLRLVGLSPSEYRRRFVPSGAAPAR